MRDAPLSADELTVARDSIARGLPSDFETNSSTVSALGGLFVYGLGADYYTKLPPAVLTVTPEAVQKAATTYLDPGKMIVVAVGDRAKIEPGLKKLNLGLMDVQAPR